MIQSADYLDVIIDRYREIYEVQCNITHDKITAILTELKDSLVVEHTLKKRIYGVVNELLENTLIHKSTESSEVELTILEDESCFRVITFNNSSIQNSENFLNYSEEINELSYTQLKTQYKDKLLHGEINDKDTIGVGMESIRLKSNNKILISTEESDNKRVIIIDVKIDKKPGKLN